MFQDCFDFWPTEDKNIESETFRIRYCDLKEVTQGIFVREVTVRSLQDDYELNTKILHRVQTENGDWLHKNYIRNFLNIAQICHKDCPNGPIVVIDR